MTDLKLTPEDQQELGEAGHLNGNLKDAFCGCWPTVKALLNWIKGLPVSQRIKEILGEIIEWGDFIHGKLCPEWAPE